MNTKKMLTLFAVIVLIFLGGCVAPSSYYGSTGYYAKPGSYGVVGSNYRSQPLFYGNQRSIGGHLHFGGGHRHSGHEHRHFGGGHRHSGHGHGHFGGGHKRGHHRGGHHR